MRLAGNNTGLRVQRNSGLCRLALGSSRWLAGALAMGMINRAGAAGVPPRPPEGVAQYREELRTAAQVVKACALSAAACREAGLPTPAVIDDAPGGQFATDWLWLADALAAARGQEDGSRRAAMLRVEGQLTSLAELAGEDTHLPAGEFALARTTADRVLAGAEFRTVEGPSWWARQLARLQEWISRFFLGINHLGNAAPWLAPLAEWGSFALALAGLLLLVRRNLQRQALRISFSEGATLPSVRGKNLAEWQTAADAFVAGQQWRDALHCLYWAAITRLEGRRAWKPNPTRTPREYLRLLDPGSEAAASLQSLTSALEQGWYGDGVVLEEDVRSAQAHLALLSSARLQRPASSAPGASIQGSLGQVGAG